MGFPDFGKVKTIILPIPSDPMSITEYKAKYGIDLKEFLLITADKYLRFKPIPNTQIFLDIGEVLKGYGSFCDSPLVDLSVISMQDSTLYVSGTTDGMSTYCVRAYWDPDNVLQPEYLVILKVDKSEELTIDNITIGGGEY